MNNHGTTLFYTTHFAHQIMKYFNVRYECLDACDDFSARGDDGCLVFQWKPDNSESHLDDLDEDEYMAMAGASFSVDTEETEEGRKYQDNFEKRLAEIKRIVISSGWLDQSVDGLPDVDLSVYEPEVIQAANKWQAAVQAKRQELIADKVKNIPRHPDGRAKTKRDPLTNKVKVVTKKYLDKMYCAFMVEEQSIIHTTVKKFELNTNQERAFRIVANHATEPHAEQLKMYLGGMGGTGKSRVIESLISFFKERGESHRFMVVAPTGSAAALLNGSTYHSTLGINDRKESDTNSAKDAAQVHARLDGVDYIFLDEVSMVSYHNLYQISACMARATKNVDIPFGGINMIFAGDFAQLPPVNGAPLYSNTVGTQLLSSMTTRSQEETIGKALWHQIDTVVILRENMRMRTQTREDQKLRTALENMQYKACTHEDVNFLCSHIAGRTPAKPKLAQKRFCDVSVITAHNLQKDEINEMGSQRFAAETKQELTTFIPVTIIVPKKIKEPKSSEERMYA